MNHGVEQTGKHGKKYWVRACMGIALLSASLELISADVEAAHPQEQQIVSYLKGNVWPISGLPKSYSLNDLTYWDSAYKQDESNGYMNVEQARTDVGREQERLIVKNGLNLYDGSCWQIALGLSGDPENISLATTIAPGREMRWEEGSLTYGIINWERQGEVTRRLKLWLYDGG